MKIFGKIKKIEKQVDEQSKQIATLQGVFEGYMKGAEEIIKELQNRIEVLEFLRNNPSGIRLCHTDKRNYDSPTRYGFEYVKGNKVKLAFMTELYNNVCVRADGNTIIIRDDNFNVIQKVEFDINNERFVYIREVKSN